MARGPFSAQIQRALAAFGLSGAGYADTEVPTWDAASGTFIPGTGGGPPAGGITVLDFTLTDAQAKTFNSTPVLMLAGTPGKTIIPVFFAMYSNTVVTGGVAFNGTGRFVGALQNVFGPLTMMSNTGPRHTSQTPTGFNIQSGVSLVGIGLEIVGSANAGATYASTDGFHIQMPYLLI